MGLKSNAVVALLCAFAIFLFYWYVVRLWHKINYYKKQGVHIVTGAYIPVLGNLLAMVPMISKAIEGTGDRSNAQLQLIRNSVATNGIYDSGKTKASLVVYCSTPMLAIQDPTMV